LESRKLRGFTGTVVSAGGLFGCFVFLIARIVVRTWVLGGNFAALEAFCARVMMDVLIG